MSVENLVNHGKQFTIRVNHDIQLESKWNIRARTLRLSCLGVAHDIAVSTEDGLDALLYVAKVIHQSGCIKYITLVEYPITLFQWFC